MTKTIGYETIQRRLQQMDSLTGSLRDEQVTIQQDIYCLLADEMTKGVQIGTLLIPEVLAIVDAATCLCLDIRLGHEEHLRGDKTSREQLVGAVERFEDFRSDLETVIDGQQGKESSKLIPDVDSDQLETVATEYRRLAMEQNLYDTLAKLWKQAKRNVLEKKSTA